MMVDWFNGGVGIGGKYRTEIFFPEVEEFHKEGLFDRDFNGLDENGEELQIENVWIAVLQQEY